MSIDLFQLWLNQTFELEEKKMEEETYNEANTGGPMNGAILALDPFVKDMCDYYNMDTYTEWQQLFTDLQSISRKVIPDPKAELNKYMEKVAKKTAEKLIHDLGLVSNETAGVWNAMKHS